MYHVIALIDQQRICLNCKHARFDDGYGVCTHGITPDEKGFVYDEDCAQIEDFGTCQDHALDMPTRASD